MPSTIVHKPIEGYIELASPQFVDDKWRDLSFDLISSQNMLQDLPMPESGGGYVYKDASVVGSPTHNRFLYWRTTDDNLELVEISTEAVLDGNQVRIRFANSPVISCPTIIESFEFVILVIPTLTSVHRICLPHPKATNKSILNELTADILLSPINYYTLPAITSTSSNRPICATSWQDGDFLKCALSFPNSSILIVQFGMQSNTISTTEIKQVGIIGRLWSRMPNLLARNPNDCDNAVFISIPYLHRDTNDRLLFTLCRDFKIRIFSTSTRECLCTHNMIPQSSFSQSFVSHANPTTELPMMKLHDPYLIVYLTENTPEFIVLQHTYENSVHLLRQISTVQAPNWEKLIDFSVTGQKIWSLANLREAESVLCYLDFRSLVDENDHEDEMVESVWDFVNLTDDFDSPTIKNYVAEIFWHNRFSLATVQKALVGIIGPSAPKKDNMVALETLAFLSLVNKDQDEAWARFFNYCLQNHQVSNKNIGLFTSCDESVVGIVKRSNPSFICPLMMSVEMLIQGRIYRGIEYSSKLKPIIKSLNHINSEVLDDESCNIFAKRIYDCPQDALTIIEELVEGFGESKDLSLNQIDYPSRSKALPGIDHICEQLDLTSSANEYGMKILQCSSTKVRSEQTPLESNTGIMLVFEMFKRLVKARMLLARDLLIYIQLIKRHGDQEKLPTSSKSLSQLSQDLYDSSKVRRLVDSMRSYAILAWIVDTPIKNTLFRKRSEVINLIAKNFRFFKETPSLTTVTDESNVEAVIKLNLFMNFLVSGGISFSGVEASHRHQQTLSNSYYVTDVALNFCRLLWPQADNICFVEFLFTHSLDDYLDKYLDLTDGWVNQIEYDHHFMRACNCILQARNNQAVDIFGRLWMNITYTNLIGRFTELKKDLNQSAARDTISVTPSLIHRYYDKLTQLFQIDNNHQCLVMLINQCLSLIDEHADDDQRRWVNRLRAKLFQSHLELEDNDEAYQTMVMMTDVPLRTNCLRKFIVSHCEKRHWSNLLSYPFIEIKNDFVDILNQKAESLDLSKLSDDNYFETSYYDLLFAYYVSGDEFRLACEIMYSYAQRLAQEVPGIVSIRKQSDSLLIALNTLRCLPESEAFIEIANYQNSKKRSSVMKRSYDDKLETTAIDQSQELHTSTISGSSPSKLTCKDLVVRYELTQARLKLLEKDQTANAIALSPLEPEETVCQLVSSSMFPRAIDLALLLKVPMEPVLEGLTAKYIFIMNLSSLDIAVYQDLERELNEIFTNSYSTIDTYNYVANSTSPLADKLWRLIDHYLCLYDGISHLYSSDDDSYNKLKGASVLMRAVATKLLSAGYNVPASLRRMYMNRNTPELLKLLIKFDWLLEAADLVVEMIDRLVSQSNAYALSGPFVFKEPPPIYLPTHLILLLISYLKEDATLSNHLKQGDVVSNKLEKFRQFVKAA